MKALFLFAASALLVVNGFAVTPSFCLTATDEYGGGPTATDTYTVPAGTEFDDYFILHDTDAEHKARVKLYADDFFIWEYDTDCGCGTNLREYPTGQNHVLHFSVECIDCSEQSYDPTGSVSVKIYTPSIHRCAPECDEN